MTNISDTTLVMRPDELRLARELSVARLEPPLHVPGYEQEAFLGKGAFGEAWRAVDSNSGRRVVIKFFNSRGGLDWSLLAREVEKLRYLFSDRHIIQLFAVGWDATPPYYVMDYMQGGSLEQLLRGRPLDMDHALAMFREIAVGLMHAAWQGDHPLRPEAGQRPARSGRSSQAGRLRSVAALARAGGGPRHPVLHGARAGRPSSRPRRAVGRLCPWRIFYHMLTGSTPFRDDPGAEDVLKPGRLEERLDRYRRPLAGAPKPSAHRLVPGVDAARRRSSTAAWRSTPRRDSATSGRCFTRRRPRHPAGPEAAPPPRRAGTVAGRGGDRGHCRLWDQPVRGPSE